MFNVQAVAPLEVLEYTVYMLPNLIACVLNLSVFIVMSRSDELQQSKHLRKSMFLHISLGCLLDFAFYAPSFFFNIYVSHSEFSCRTSIFFTELGVGVKNLSLVLAIFSRYFNIVNPYNKLARFLQRDLGIFIWAVTVISHSPYLMAHGITTESGFPHCSVVLENWSKYQMFLPVIHSFLSLAAYLAALHLILRTKVPDDVVNDEVHRMTWASGIVERCLLVTAIAMLPLQVSVMTVFGLDHFLHVASQNLCTFMIAISILEPLCFAICDASFQQEYMIQTSLPESYNLPISSADRNTSGREPSFV